MKIVDVCAFYAPRGGGVRTYVDRKLAIGPSMGHEIVVVAPGPDDAVEIRGERARIRWVRSPRLPLDRNYRYFAGRETLHAVLDEERPDVVEASSPWRSATTVAEWRGDAVRSLVVHADPLAAYAYRWFGGVLDRSAIDRAFARYWRHLRRLDERFDVVISPSESLSRRLAGGGLRAVATVPMGVENGLFCRTLRDPDLRARLLARCGLGPEATLLAGVGRYAAEKRWEMVIRAVAMAGHQSPVGLVLVGDGRGRARLERAIAGNPHVRLIAPIADRTMLARLLASADGLIHGCEAETFCFAAAEALASALPLIAPAGGGASDHVRASGGYAYDPGSAASAARAITALVAAAGSPNPPRSIRTMRDHYGDLFALYRRRLLAHTADTRLPIAS